jgi:hypothetical protein
MEDVDTVTETPYKALTWLACDSLKKPFERQKPGQGFKLTATCHPNFLLGFVAREWPLLPPGALIPQNAVVPFLALRRPAQPFPALFLIFWLSLRHVDTPQALILYP